MTSSCVITFGDLWTYRIDNTDLQLPLSCLPDEGYGHIHGRLEIRISGKLLPYLSYAEPNDTCFGLWLNELRHAITHLDPSDEGEYIFDEGEQGQPAYQFRRSRDILSVSIIDSELTGESGDPDWQNVRCKYDDFVDAVTELQQAFIKAVLQQSPTGGSAWLKRFLR